jgi:hypothetical protein
MDIGAAFVADGEAAEAMQPRDRALDHPAADAEPAAMRRPAPCEDRRDAMGPQAITVRLRVIAAVALQGTRLAARPPASASYGGQCLDERVQLRDVVDVGRGYLRDEGDAARVGNEVVFGALLAAIGWVRSSFFPPRTARTDPLSITVQRWSSRPRRRSSASSVSCSRCHTPVRCQWTNRRQQVLPDPQPIWRGSICHGMPDRNTNRMPVRIARSGIGVRPCRWPRFGRRRGSSASSRAQMASSIKACDMPDRTKASALVQEGCQ